MSRSPGPSNPSRMLWRFGPLLFLAVGFAAFFMVGAHRYFTFEVIAEKRQILLDWVDHRLAWALLGYMGVYILIIAFALPLTAVLSITGGFLFGPTGLIAVLTAVTIGSMGPYLAVRTAVGDSLRKKAGPHYRRIEEGFRRNAMNYLLVLRLLPVVPLPIQNIAAGMFGIRLGTYLVATFIGLIPVSFVLIMVGNGLGVILDAGRIPDRHILLEPEVLLPLLGLAALAVIPVFFRPQKRRETQPFDEP